VRKQDFVLQQGIKIAVELMGEDGKFSVQPECYGEREIGAFRPRSLGPSLGPAGWYVHRLLDWIPAGLLQGQDNVVDDVVRWVVLQDDPLQEQLIATFPEYMQGVQLQLPPLTKEPKAAEDRIHRFTVVLRVKTAATSFAGAKNQVIAELDELMRWPSPMTIEGIGEVRRVTDSVEL
jgi:hypothetical protein